MQDKATKHKLLREKYLHVAATADPRASVSETVRNKDARDNYVALQGVKSLHEVFQRSVARYSDNSCLGRRVDGIWVWETYGAVAETVAAVASALAAVGVTAHGRAGIYSVNCPEWMVAMQACNRMTIYTIPLYDTLGKDAVKYVVKHSECSIVFVSTANWSKLIGALPDLLDLVHTLVYWGAGDVDRQPAINQGLKVISWQEFLEAGKAKPAEPVPPGPDDLCTIMYTSGTTGDPKGVKLSHRIVMHCIAAQEHIAYQADGLKPCDEDDVILSWLPLSHIMERSAEEFMLHVGARIGYYSGSVTTLMGDILSLRPTLFIAPPRVWDRVYAGAMAKLNRPGLLNWMLRALFNYAYNYKLRRLKQDVPFYKAAPFFDRLVFVKTRAALGGRVRIALSGSAPLASHVEEFLRTTLCCHFAQGYGLTETCATSFYSSSTEWESFGTVGIPAATLEYRLESIPEMNYDAVGTPPQGEICIRGPTVFLGYHKDPGRTAEVIDKDGWFHTGDVGEIAASGALKVIDRKKQIFKLAQGEYLAPFKIESAYGQLPLISQIFVHGNMTESRLVAVVVPEEAAFMEAARHEGLNSSIQELVHDPKAEAMLLSRMEAVADSAGLKGFERVKGLILEPEAWSVDNGLLTPTLKAKRRELLAKYQPAIDRLYLRMNGKVV